NRPPEVIYRWFKNNFVKDYKKWHPKDNILAKWLKCKGFEPGSVLYAEEYLGDEIEKLTFKITKNIPNSLIEYKVLLPESIICSGGSFLIKPHVKGSTFTATLTFRFGFILSKFLAKRVNALKRHMKEEGENLKKLLEQD
ncbi:MAG: hypothetical protein JSV54_01095, partial [Chloroflexota bacterium]